jgi:hypothetical protein
MQSHTFLETQFHTETLKTIITLCGAGLVVSLFLTAYGIDLGIGVF